MTIGRGADAWLVDDRWGKAYALANVTTIGRGSDSAIIVRDPAVSRLHAEVRRQDETYILVGHGSAGTKVNGMRVASDVVLQEGDQVEIAFTTLRFTMIAPTNEMFVVSRDRATPMDQPEVPTRATLHAMHPITLVSRFKQLWRRLTGRPKTD